MAEAYKYRTENVYDENGNVVDTATFRLPNQRNAGNTAGIGGGVATGSQRLDWSHAEWRGTAPGGRVRQLIRSAAGRGAARNPRMRNNRYGL